jgi:ATP-dependent Clp protease ATP-binding subunit ClpA
MYGARPIKRWVEKNVMTMLCDMLIKEEAMKGSNISIEARDDNKAGADI